LELAVDCDEVSVLGAFVRLKLKVCITKHIDQLVKPYRRDPAIISGGQPGKKIEISSHRVLMQVKRSTIERYLAPDLLKQLLPFIQAFNVTAYCF